MKRHHFKLMGCFLCFSAVSMGLLIGHFQHLTPCSLCYLERVTLIVLGMLFIFSVYHYRNQLLNAVISGAIMLLSLVGVSLTSYHLYLQQHHDNAVGCGATLQYWLANYPLSEALVHFIASPQECGIVDWEFLGLSMAGYALILFVGVFTLELLTYQSKR